MLYFDLFLADSDPPGAKPSKRVRGPGKKNMERLDFKPGVVSTERDIWLDNRILHFTTELGKIEAGAGAIFAVCYVYDELDHVSVKGQSADLMKELAASYQIEHLIRDEVKRRVRAMQERMANDTPTLNDAICELEKLRLLVGHLLNAAMPLPKRGDLAYSKCRPDHVDRAVARQRLEAAGAAWYPESSTYRDPCKMPRAEFENVKQHCHSEL